MRRLTVALATAVAAVPAAAAAHVAPSEDTNNRYVKLTPMADRVRLAYTILIGQGPGRIARAGLDLDRDGIVSESEADRWGQELGRRVLADLELTIDGTPVPVAWSEVAPGFDDRSSSGGAFSLDLIAWVCVPSPGARHQVDLVDGFSLTPAGETEVRIADEPGIRVEVSRVGDGVAGDMLGRVAQFQKLAAPLAGGLHVVYTNQGATALADGRCEGAKKTTRTTPRWPAFVGAAGALVIVTVLALRRRKQRV